MSDRKIPTSLPPDSQIRYSSVRLRMIKSQSELYIPVEGEWLNHMGFPLSTPVRIIVIPSMISISALSYEAAPRARVSVH